MHGKEKFGAKCIELKKRGGEYLIIFLWSVVYYGNNWNIFSRHDDKKLISRFIEIDMRKLAQVGLTLIS